MKRWIKRLSIVTVVVSAVAATMSWWAIRQTKQVPEFYSQATPMPTPARIAASRQIEADVLRLREAAARRGSWQAAFSDRQINAWLTEALPEKFPRLLAGGASDPRIVIRDGELLAAARFKNRHLDTVVSCRLEVKLTEQPNMLAIKVRDLRAGALPLPLSKFVGGITREAARGDIEIKWDYTGGDPVALVVVPREHPNYAVKPLVIESVGLADGSLTLNGHSGPGATHSYTPRGPLYRFVSYRPVRSQTR